MKAKRYEVLMDIYRGVLNTQTIQFTTEDFGMCQIAFKLLEDRITPYNLSNCIVRMVINGQQQDCVIESPSEGKATITLLQSMFSQVGCVTAELQIYDATNQTLRLTTPCFKYHVNKSLMDDDTVQSDNNFTILQDMINSVGNIDNKIANKIDKSQIKNTLTETTTGNVLDATQGKKLADQINVLSNTKSEYIGKAFISEEILLDATYPIAYCGSVGNSSTMPNTGQFRVQYIPYFANNEGYSVQIAWGVVTNSGLWYRVASGTRWERWESFSTTTKTDILITPRANRTVIYNNSYKDSMGFIVDVKCKQTDDSDFIAGTYYDLCQGLPDIKEKYCTINGSCFNSNGDYVGDAYGYRWGTAIYIYPRVNCKSIVVYARCGGV